MKVVGAESRTLNGLKEGKKNTDAGRCKVEKTRTAEQHLSYRLLPLSIEVKGSMLVVLQAYYVVRDCSRSPDFEPVELLDQIHANVS